MAESEDIFLRAKNRTFSGLTEGSRLSLAYLAQPVSLNLHANALANALSNLGVTQVVVAGCRLMVWQSKRSNVTANCVALFLWVTVVKLSKASLLASV